MQVICKLFKVSTLIDGVKFTEHKLGVISEEVSEAVGERLLSIGNFFIRVGKPTPAAPTTGATPPATVPTTPTPTPTATPTTTPAATSPPATK